jgi:ribosomal protein S20
MGKSKKRGGAKAHRKRVQARNEKIKGKQNAFIKQFRERLDAGVQEELQKQADEVRAQKEVDGTEERTVLDTTMSSSPIVDSSSPSK